LRSNPSDDGRSKDLPEECTVLPQDLADALARVHQRLDGLGSTILYFPTIGSTNDVALALAAQGDRDGAIVIADEQTAGRGRHGRAWFSPPGSGVYVSVVLAPARARSDPARATTLLTLMAGVALAEAIEAVTALRVDIKWPNDLGVARRKLAGILAEAPAARANKTTTGAARASGGGIPRAVNNVDDFGYQVVVGYGINISAAAYPPELRDRATSIETELGRPIDRAALCAETLVSLAQRYADLLDGRFDAILDAWRDRAPGSRGARVTWQAASGPQAGITAGIDDRGALLVRVGDRIERIVAGEVSWI
jgi:BirA family biotin operon repressor/biotin-[acetyl-CoA-carboxylase] ligase